MAQNFTDLMLRKLTSGGRDRLEVWDERIPGFRRSCLEGRHQDLHSDLPAPRPARAG